MKEPRTFGELMRDRPWLFFTDGQCRLCHRFAAQCPRRGVWKYSTRHYLCDECIAPRKDELLPNVARRERFRKKHGFNHLAEAP